MAISNALQEILPNINDELPRITVVQGADGSWDIVLHVDGGYGDRRDAEAVARTIRLNIIRSLNG
jgi:hypothetical protein